MLVQMKTSVSKIAPPEEVLGLNHRNTMKHIKKTSTSKPHGLDA